MCVILCSGAFGIYYLRKGGNDMTQKLTLAEKAGKNLKNLIKKSVYKTQDEFAVNAMMVDPSTVRKWIAHGIRDINLLEEIAEVLDIDFMELLR